MKTMFAVGHTTPSTLVIRYNAGPGLRPRRRIIARATQGTVDLEELAPRARPARLSPIFAEILADWYENQIPSEVLAPIMDPRGD